VRSFQRTTATSPGPMRTSPLFGRPRSENPEPERSVPVTSITDRAMLVVVGMFLRTLRLCPDFGPSYFTPVGGVRSGCAEAASLP